MQLSLICISEESPPRSPPRDHTFHNKKHKTYTEVNPYHFTVDDVQQPVRASAPPRNIAAHLDKQ